MGENGCLEWRPIPRKAFFQATFEHGFKRSFESVRGKFWELKSTYLKVANFGLGCRFWVEKHYARS